MDFGSFKHDALGEQIVERLLTLITEKRLKPGDRLPPERELAAMMGVSRPSLREALRALSIMNVVEIRQGAGTFITSLQTEMLVEHLDFVFFLDDSTFMQLFEVRKILEVGIIGLAAANIADEELAELEACMEKSRQSVDDNEAFMQADIELHRIIGRASRNPILNRFMESISRLGMASRRRTTELRGVPHQVIADHDAILTALKRHNPEAARQAMLDHLAHVEQRLVEAEKRQRSAETIHQGKTR